VTLVSSILVDGYRETNMVALGRALNTNQVTEALRLLNQIFSSIYGFDAGEALGDWPLGNFGRENPQYTQEYFTEQQIDRPNINKRLIAVNEQPRTVYFTPFPQDGSRMAIIDPYSRLSAFPVTINANGRTIEGTEQILIDTDGTSRQWFYRADTGNWTRISDVADTDEMPFPPEYDIMFIILLALRLSPRYGRTMPAESATVLQQKRQEFVARYLQSQPLEIDDSISWPFLSQQSYDTQRQFTTTQRDFNSGFWRPV